MKNKPLTELTLAPVIKRVSDTLTLDVEHLNLKAGQCVWLSGRNGAGKTSLLKLAAGLDWADQLSVHHQKKRWSGALARRFLHQHVVYLHQHPYMFDASVFDNIAYGLRRQSWTQRDIHRRVESILEWIGLTHLAERNAKTLSGGEKQRVALARARVVRPHFLFLDEPTAGMDQESREQTYGLIERLSQDGIGVVLTTHEDMGFRANLYRCIRLEGGRLHIES